VGAGPEGEGVVLALGAEEAEAAEEGVSVFRALVAVAGWERVAVACLKLRE
jgi:hypothetical protein